ncbi:binding-protein-dependent transport systems inner membrane component [Denitrovibrio acetiphilus DSM 12809]|jgi:nickel transport system permease protein|uniref:Binding-protein-dependent transport systems inner membrane component n=1 Tax=Denitrovibrio acetiphilus (strain DSM 12809 / NBRC 114555 / N2460) TaxID=522772 RepID=D4H8J3_DENA2|nr:nickel ABC transporter permease [Denitrovibrio acetiphilus]ADD68342.1 binding-protein-dependent transport systems inner membrane component [Denitrovibrio acetiphilus DSM 12809]
MAAFILKRIGLLIPIMFAVSVIVFGVLRLGPIDPALAYLLNSRIPPTQEALEVTRVELGLNKPLVEQYVHWLKNAAVLDFGKSYTTKRDVFGDLMYYFPTTLKLACTSMLVVILLSIPMGIAAALRRNRIFDNIVKLISFIGVSTPSFWLGFILMYFFAVKLQLLPAFGEHGVLSYIMPILTLSFMSIAINTRLTRTSFLEHFNQRSVTYARVMGVSEKKIVSKYTLKNSMLPIVTSFGMHFGELLGGAVVVETLFAWPGVGRYVVSSIHNHDYPVIQCFMILMTAIFVIMNLATDIVYAYLNPKIRYEK